MSPLASAVDALSCRFSATCKAPGPACLFGGTKWVKQMELLHYSQVYNIIKDVPLNLEGKSKVKTAKTVSEVTTCARDNHEARRTRGAFTRWSLTQTVVMRNARTEGRKISLVCLPSSCCEILLDLWTGVYGRGQRVCRHARVAAHPLLWPAMRRGDVWGRETATRSERVAKETSLVLMKCCEFCLFVQTPRWVITDCAAVRGFVWVRAALWQPQSVITDLDCCLLALRGLWRCTWEAAHTCLGLARVLNWFIGPWFDALSRS